MPFAFCLPPALWGRAYTQKPFHRAVNRKRYNTLDFHGKSCATKPTVSLDSSLSTQKTEYRSSEQHPAFYSAESLNNHKSSFRPVFSVHLPGQSHNNHRYSGSRPLRQDDSAALPSRSAYRMTTPSRQHRDR